MWTRSFLVLMAMGVSSACRPAQEPEKSAVNAACEPGTAWMLGSFRYVNDQWGSAKAHGKFEQCLLKRAGSSEVGWRWSWPGLDLSVFAYPSATFGWKPWVGGAPTDPRLPLRVGDVRRLELRYDVATEAHGSYNLAPEVWFLRERPSSNAQNPKLISQELMFWLEYAGDATPAGQMVDTPTIGGKTYEFWSEENIGKEANGVGWRLLSFKSRSQEPQGRLEIHEFLKYLAGKGLLNANEYVASVEFGNEIMGGEGTTWIKRLEVEVEPAPP